MAHLGILVTSSPLQSENWETALAIGESALDKGHRVSFFFSMDGVLNPLRPGLSSPGQGGSQERFQAAAARGASLCLCGTAAQARGLAASDFIAGVRIGGLPDLAMLVSEVDRLVSL